GNSFYSHNQFERAIDQWRQILVLDPDNQTAQEHIQRAERALSKLRFLRARQNGEVGIIDKQ
ncbi:MAG: hypothetical protein GXP10_05660, partial [Gammaproteobacteria bacterium]|nr:hypothetical protein [Gammaproteobacteria bacterium]